MQFTNKTLTELKPRNTKYELTSDEITGLKIRVMPNGNKYFYLHYRNKEQHKRKLAIGRYPDISTSTAKKAASQLLAEITLGGDPLQDKKDQQAELSNGTTLRQWLGDPKTPAPGTYYDYVLQNNRTRVNITTIEGQFQRFMNRKLDTLTEVELNKWRKEELARGIQPQTINRCRACLNGCLNHAVDQDVLEFNPLRKFKPLKTQNTHVIRYLDETDRFESKRLYAALPNITGHTTSQTADWFNPFVHLLFNTGLRCNEARTLLWTDINLHRGSVTVRAANSKSGKIRTAPFNKKIFAIMKTWRSETPEATCVFEFRNEPVSRNSIRYPWDRLMKEAKIKNFRMHDARHDFASRLVQAGVDLNVVRELLGHSDMKMTQIYAHLAPETLQSAVEKIA